MAIENQDEIEQQWCLNQFATHKATLIQDTDRYFIADWRKADGSGEYYINFILDKKRGSLIISGDLGDCIATWYNTLTPVQLNSYIRHNVGYFIGKFQASSDKYFYDDDEVFAAIKQQFKEFDIHIVSGIDYEDEDDFWEIVKEEVRESCDGRVYRPTEKLVRLIEEYDKGYWEWLYRCGESVAKRVYMWVYSFDCVLKQLGYIGGNENATDI